MNYLHLKFKYLKKVKMHIIIKSNKANDELLDINLIRYAFVKWNQQNLMQKRIPLM